LQVRDGAGGGSEVGRLARWRPEEEADCPSTAVAGSLAGTDSTGSDVVLVTNEVVVRSVVLAGASTVCRQRVLLVARSLGKSLSHASARVGAPIA
jgi:hypothetical protein